MPDMELLTQAKELAETAATKADEYSGVLGSIRELILEHFGHNGLLAAYVAGGVLLLVLVSRLFKISFAALKYLVIPSLVLAGLASYFTGFSFAVSLPVTVAACSLVLLFKG